MSHEFAPYGSLLVILVAGRLVDACTGPLSEALIVGGRVRLELANLCVFVATVIVACACSSPRTASRAWPRRSRSAPSPARCRGSSRFAGRCARRGAATSRSRRRSGAGRAAPRPHADRRRPQRRGAGARGALRAASWRGRRRTARRGARARAAARGHRDDAPDARRGGRRSAPAIGRRLDGGRRLSPGRRGGRLGRAVRLAAAVVVAVAERHDARADRHRLHAGGPHPSRGDRRPRMRDVDARVSRAAGPHACGAACAARSSAR